MSTRRYYYQLYQYSIDLLVWHEWKGPCYSLETVPEAIDEVNTRCVSIPRPRCRWVQIHRFIHPRLRVPGVILLFRSLKCVSSGRSDDVFQSPEHMRGAGGQGVVLEVHGLDASVGKGHCEKCEDSRGFHDRSHSPRVPRPTLDVEDSQTHRHEEYASQVVIV
jgi:hypothetical protein